MTLFSDFLTAGIPAGLSAVQTGGSGLKQWTEKLEPDFPTKRCDDNGIEQPAEIRLSRCLR